MTRWAWTLAGCAAALGGMLQAAPAHATIFDFFVNGTVTSGTDQTNTFGLGANADLTGRTYLAHFVYDSSARTPFIGSNVYQSEAGAFNGEPSPMSATITINGVALAISGTYDGGLYLDNKRDAPNRATAEFEAGTGIDTVTNNENFLGTYLLLGGLFGSPSFVSSFDPPDLAAPFFVNPESGDTLFATFSLPAADGINENEIGLDVEHVANFFLGNSSAGAAGVAGLGDGGSIPVGVTTLAVPPSPDGVLPAVDVPEPPSVALTAIGLGIVMLRRRSGSASLRRGGLELDRR